MKHKNWIWDINGSIYRHLRFLRSLPSPSSRPAYAPSIDGPISCSKWTQEIHKEWMRNLLKNRPDLTIERLESVRARMDLHVRDGLVDGYEELIDGIKLPDLNDRHVLAAAIKANAQTIITYNLSDFPSSTLSKYEIDAQHPDEFLRHLLDLAPAKVIATVQETRKSLKNPCRYSRSSAKRIQRIRFN
jgi:hypothetical protein